MKFLSHNLIGLIAMYVASYVFLLISVYLSQGEMHLSDKGFIILGIIISSGIQALVSLIFAGLIITNAFIEKKNKSKIILHIVYLSILVMGNTSGVYRISQRFLEDDIGMSYMYSHFWVAVVFIVIIGIGLRFMQGLYLQFTHKFLMTFVAMTGLISSLVSLVTSVLPGELPVPFVIVGIVFSFLLIMVYAGFFLLNSKDKIHLNLEKIMTVIIVGFHLGFLVLFSDQIFTYTSIAILIVSWLSFSWLTYQKL